MQVIETRKLRKGWRIDDDDDEDHNMLWEMNLALVIANPDQAICYITKCLAIFEYCSLQIN